MIYIWIASILALVVGAVLICYAAFRKASTGGTAQKAPLVVFSDTESTRRLFTEFGYSRTGASITLAPEDSTLYDYNTMSYTCDTIPFPLTSPSCVLTPRVLDDLRSGRFPCDEDDDVSTSDLVVPFAVAIAENNYHASWVADKDEYIRASVKDLVDDLNANLIMDPTKPDNALHVKFAGRIPGNLTETTEHKVSLVSLNNAAGDNLMTIFLENNQFFVQSSSTEQVLLLDASSNMVLDDWFVFQTVLKQNTGPDDMQFSSHLAAGLFDTNVLLASFTTVTSSMAETWPVDRVVATTYLGGFDKCEILFAHANVDDVNNLVVGNRYVEHMTSPMLSIASFGSGTYDFGLPKHRLLSSSQSEAGNLYDCLPTRMNINISQTIGHVEYTGTRGYTYTNQHSVEFVDPAFIPEGADDNVIRSRFVVGVPSFRKKTNASTQSVFINYVSSDVVQYHSFENKPLLGFRPEAHVISPVHWPSDSENYTHVLYVHAFPLGVTEYPTLNVATGEITFLNYGTGLTIANGYDMRCTLTSTDVETGLDIINDVYVNYLPRNESFKPFPDVMVVNYPFNIELREGYSVLDPDAEASFNDTVGMVYDTVINVLTITGPDVPDVEKHDTIVYYRVTGYGLTGAEELYQLRVYYAPTFRTPADEVLTIANFNDSFTSNNVYGPDFFQFELVNGTHESIDKYPNMQFDNMTGRVHGELTRCPIVSDLMIRAVLPPRVVPSVDIFTDSGVLDAFSRIVRIEVDNCKTYEYLSHDHTFTIDEGDEFSVNPIDNGQETVIFNKAGSNLFALDTSAIDNFETDYLFLFNSGRITIRKIRELHGHWVSESVDSTIDLVFRVEPSGTTYTHRFKRDPRAVNPESSTIEYGASYEFGYRRDAAKVKITPAGTPPPGTLFSLVDNSSWISIDPLTGIVTGDITKDTLVEYLGYGDADSTSFQVVETTILGVQMNHTTSFRFAILDVLMDQDLVITRGISRTATPLRSTTSGFIHTVVSTVGYLTAQEEKTFYLGNMSGTMIGNANLHTESVAPRNITVNMRLTDPAGPLRFINGIVVRVQVLIGIREFFDGAYEREMSIVGYAYKQAFLGEPFVSTLVNTSSNAYLVARTSDPLPNGVTLTDNTLSGTPTDVMTNHNFRLAIQEHSNTPTVVTVAYDCKGHFGYVGDFNPELDLFFIKYNVPETKLPVHTLAGNSKYSYKLFRIIPPSSDLVTINVDTGEITIGLFTKSTSTETIVVEATVFERASGEIVGKAVNRLTITGADNLTKNTHNNTALYASGGMLCTAGTAGILYASLYSTK